ncbi:kinetochore protein NDC80 [Tanacetum coccineum]
MRGPAGRRPNPDHRYTTPTPMEPPHYSTTTSRRDSVLSDTSFASSRPSSARQNKNNQIRSFKKHAMATINNYLSLNQFHIKLKPSPSDKDIFETLKFVLSRLDYPLSNKLEEDLSLVLKFFNCPVKFNKLWLKTPGTPLCFPSVLIVMHWLVQLAFYNDHVVNSSNVISNDSMFDYCLTSYLHYIAGDDDAVDREDAAFTHKIQFEVDTVKEKINAKAENVKELEAKLEAMRSGPSLREVKEEEKSLLEKDVNKFNDLIEQLRDHEARVEKQMEEKEKQLRVKVEERSMISAENEELKRKVEEQGFNMRDAERMKRELQAVERDIGEAEIERNKWEEKSWDLNAVIGTKWKELEALQLECNQAIRRSIQVDVCIGDKILQPKESFRYLGSILHKSGRIDEDSINKMREGRLRWFGHVRRRPHSAPVRRVEALVVDGLRRRGRPKLRWEDRVKQDMKELLLSEDMTSDRNEWRARIRLKLGTGFQYELNAKGSTPVEVLGDYKSAFKPVLKSSIEEVKRRKLDNLESKVHLQQVSSDISAKIKAKENRIAILQSEIDQLNSQIGVIQKETQDYISRCEMEARQLQKKFEAESHNVELVEQEAREFLENAKEVLQETIIRSEEEVQMCAHELLALIDSVSKYKEFTVSKISQMKGIASETALAIVQAHNDSLASSIGTSRSI